MSAMYETIINMSLSIVKCNIEGLYCYQKLANKLIQFLSIELISEISNIF